MASLTHLVVGLAAGQHLAKRPSFWPMVLMGGLSLSPDLDVIGFSFGVSYHSPFGHRGFTHSLCFAVCLGALIGVLRARYLSRTLSQRSDHRSATYWGTIAGLVALSHPLLDALTTGGLGVALWWPLSSERIFLSPRLIPVAPIGLGMLSARGLYVLLVEAALCLPLWIYLAWPWFQRLVKRWGQSDA